MEASIFRIRQSGIGGWKPWRPWGRSVLSGSPGWGGLTGVVERLGLGVRLAGCGFEIEDGFAGEFGDIRVGVAEKPNHQPEPAELGRVNPDQGNGFRHGMLSQNISEGRMEI